MEKRRERREKEKQKTFGELVDDEDGEKVGNHDRVRTLATAPPKIAAKFSVAGF